MEKKIKFTLTKNDFVFLDKIVANMPAPWSKQAEAIILSPDETKLKYLIDKFGAELKYQSA